MTNEELSRIKEDDVIYDDSAELAYSVIKVYTSGILTYLKWTNPYGRFAENKFFKNEKLLCKNMMLM